MGLTVQPPSYCQTNGTSSTLLDSRFELFFESLNGGGTWWNVIIKTVSSTLSILEGVLDWYKAKVIFYLASLIEAPPTDGNWIAMQAKIDG